MKRTIIAFSLLFSITGILAGFSDAGAAVDDVTSSDKYFPDYQYDADMKSAVQPKSFSNSGIQYGGWLTPIMIDQRGGKSLDTAIINARLWMKMFLWDDSFIYVRARNIFTGVLHQEGYRLSRANNVIDLDVGFLEMSNHSHSMTLSIGRKFFLVGAGIVLDGRADGLQFSFRTPYVNGSVFGAYTGLILKDDNPYGLSDKDFSTGAKRLFTGGTLSWDFFNQKLYLLGVLQLDYGKEYSYQKSRYNSVYYGIGMNGVITRGLFYYGEFVYEMGKSVLSGTTRLKNIRACAAIFSLYYYFNTRLNPVLIAQYAFGSGDNSRDNNHSPDGNFKGNDTGFISFGTFSGGYGLRPLLANIHILRAGFALSPFDWTGKDYLKLFTLIVKYSYYMKHKADAPINYGFDAVRNSRDIGHGLDVSVRWRIFQDLSAFVNYGLFLPGNAFYASEANRHFTMVGCTISF